MDPELAKSLMELREAVARVDERTVAILAHQEEHVKNFVAHEEHDREDFKEVHDRITKVDRKQNWMLGVGSAIVVFVTTFFTGIFGG